MPLFPIWIQNNSIAPMFRKEWGGFESRLLGVSEQQLDKHLTPRGGDMYSLQAKFNCQWKSFIWLVLSIGINQERNYRTCERLLKVPLYDFYIQVMGLYSENLKKIKVAFLLKGCIMLPSLLQTLDCSLDNRVIMLYKWIISLSLWFFFVSRMSCPIPFSYRLGYNNHWVKTTFSVSQLTLQSLSSERKANRKRAESLHAEGPRFSLGIKRWSWETFVSHNQQQWWKMMFWGQDPHITLSIHECDTKNTWHYIHTLH